MVDIPGDATTTRSISIGGTIDDLLEVGADTDWFRIDLTAGQSISVIVQALTLADPVVRIRDASGTVLYQNDDWGVNLDSFVAFAAPSTGTYFIDVGSAPNNQTGTYRLMVTPYTPPPVGTLDDIARQLTHGYWYEDPHHFDVSGSRSITVNLTGLEPQGLAVARLALAIWTDIIGVTFPEVATGGQIVFGQANEGTGAFSTSIWANGITSSATVNVAPSRLNLHTYMHEIAHALGLGHAGDYNGGTAFSRFPYEAMWLNDGAAVSIMSYFDNGESSYYSGLGFTNTNIVTPQLADIIAMGNLYGLSTTTRTGDTTYGFNNNSGRDIFNAALNPNVAYTIFDSGGIDTLDYSGFSNNQHINLNAESFSNIGFGMGNVSIARGTVIENAVGGSGNDTLIGNGAGNVLAGGGGSNTLSGGAGSDTFRGTAAQLSGDTITDFSFGDRIHFIQATTTDFTFSLSANTLSYSGGALTLLGVAGSLVASAAPEGGVQLKLVALAIGPAAALSAADFNGDGRDDILWRNVNGDVTNWLGQANGSFAGNSAVSYNALDNSWHVAGVGDFNGDGRSDVLWRNINGDVTDWLGLGNGSYAGNFANSYNAVGTNWYVTGIGDFDGDGHADVLWRNVNGDVTNWLGQENGGFAGNLANSYNAVSNGWQVAGIGDFDGDRRDDVLWRNSNGDIVNWLGQSNGGFAGNYAASYNAISNGWQVAGVGDFNGDGRDDVLWRNANGDVTNWLGQPNGGFAGNYVASYTAVSNSWSIVGIGDFDGDGRADVLWRHANGDVTNWLGQGNGGFAGNYAASYNSVHNSWQVAGESTSLF